MNHTSDYDDPEHKARRREPVKIASEPFLLAPGDLGRLKREFERGYRKFAEKCGWRITDPAGRDIKPRDEDEPGEARP